MAASYFRIVYMYSQPVWLIVATTMHVFDELDVENNSLFPSLLRGAEQGLPINFRHLMRQAFGLS